MLQGSRVFVIGRPLHVLVLAPSTLHATCTLQNKLSEEKKNSLSLSLSLSLFALDFALKLKSNIINNLT
jgi:hypothetical protein